MSTEHSMEAERVAFEAWQAGPQGEWISAALWRDASGEYGESEIRHNWRLWQAARRTAPVSAPLDTQALPKWIDDHKGADPFMDDVIAYIEGMHSQYAERIRHLERELGGYQRRSAHESELMMNDHNYRNRFAQQPAQSIGDDREFIAMMGDYRDAMGSKTAARLLNALIAYIDGRTAGAAWISVEDRKPAKDQHVIIANRTEYTNAPPSYLVSTAMYDGWNWCAHGHHLYEPTHWMPLPSAPSSMASPFKPCECRPEQRARCDYCAGYGKSPSSAPSSMSKGKEEAND